jgi:hypothetical protein
VIDTLWLMAGGSFTDVTFDNVCAAVNTAPTPTPTLTPTPTPTATPTPAPGTMALPVAQNAPIVYAPVQNPVVTPAAGTSRPISVGPAAAGGALFELNVGLSALSGPADVYLAFTTDYPGLTDLYFFDSNNQIIPLSAALFSLPKWKTNSSAPITTFPPLLQFPGLILPQPTSFSFFLLVTPFGSLSNWYVWATNIVLGGGGGQPMPTPGTSPTPTPTPSGGSTMEQEIRRILDLIMGLFSTGSGLVSQVSGILSGAGSDIITISPPLENLSLTSIPPTIALNFNFGTQYALPDGSVISGSAMLNLTDISFSAAGIGANIELLANDIRVNGAPMLSGRVFGNVALTNDVNAVLNFDNFRFQDRPFSGGLDILGTAVELDLGNPVNSTFQQFTITPRNFSFDQYTVNSGTIVITIPSPGVYRFALDLATNQGPANLVATLALQQEEQFLVSTVGPGTILGYTVTIDNVLFDTSLCPQFPIGGRITVASGGKTGEITFNAACNGTYGYSERDRMGRIRIVQP